MALIYEKKWIVTELNTDNLKNRNDHTRVKNLFNMEFRLERNVHNLRTLINILSEFFERNCLIHNIQIQEKESTNQFFYCAFSKLVAIRLFIVF